MNKFIRSVLILLFTSSPIICHNSSAIELEEAILKLMLSSEKDADGLLATSINALTASEAFEGCIFDSFSLGDCSKKRSSDSDQWYCDMGVIEKVDLFHYATKCRITWRGENIVSKNLPRDYRMGVYMYGPRCCITSLKIFSLYLNPHTLFSEVLEQSSKVVSKPIKCSGTSSMGFSKWYEITAEGKKPLYGFYTHSAGASGLGTQELHLFYELPKDAFNKERASYGDWNDKCK